MKVSKAMSFLFGSALLIASSAVAAENKSTVQVEDKITVEGKSLPTGRYTVEWSGSGPTVQVTLLHNKETVATFSAHVTEQANANPQGAYSTQASPDGSKALTAIYPGGKRFALQLEQTQAAQQSSAHAAN